jgi:NADPH:quinone reductase
MRAVVFDAFGGPEVLQVRTIDDPAAGPGDVVVKVAAATVNPTDTLMRAGKQAAMMTDLAPHYVAGMEFAGRVHRVGAGVSDFAPGQPVMGVVNPRRPGGGAHAEYVSVPAASIVPLDPAADLVAAATLPMNGLTALMVLEALTSRPPGTVLVTGAAGAVGGYVIQLAKLAGLRVVADAKSEDVELVRTLGADDIVPRGSGFSAAVVRCCPAGADAVVDAALLGTAVAGLVRNGGMAVCLRRADAIQDPRLDTRYINVTARMNDTDALRRLASLLANRILQPRVGLALPMSDAAQAHQLVERGGVRGRVVLRFE